MNYVRQLADPPNDDVLLGPYHIADDAGLPLCRADAGEWDGWVLVHYRHGELVCAACQMLRRAPDADAT